MPKAIPGEMEREAEPEEVDAGQHGARSLLTYLEAHVDHLTEELAEVRTEMRGVRYEAESLRIEAGRAQVFAALVEAERQVRGDQGRAGPARGRIGRAPASLACPHMRNIYSW